MSKQHGKQQKFLPFSNNHNQLFENSRKQTINNFVGTLLENGRNFGRFPTTGFRPFSNNPKCFGRFPTKRFRPFSYNFFRPFSTSPRIRVSGQDVNYEVNLVLNYELVRLLEAPGLPYTPRLPFILSCSWNIFSQEMIDFLNIQYFTNF